MFSGLKRNYTFSEYVKSDLIEFLKAARQKTKDNPQQELWSKLLPQNVALLEELSGVQEETSENIIDLTEDSSHSKEEPVIQSHIELLGCSFVEELGDLIKESLITENSLSKAVVTKLNTECGASDFKTLFDNLKTLDNDLLYFLGRSLLTHSTIESSDAAFHYFKFVLLVKLKQMQNNDLKQLLHDYLSKLKSLVRCELVEEMQTNISRFLLNNLNALDAQHKKSILRDFIISSSKLEQEHFFMLEMLLTNEIETDALKKLLELLLAVAGNYSADKTFGKLLLALVKTSNKNAATFQQQFQDILTKHKSIWKNQVSKALEASCEHFKFTQNSFMY